MSNDELKKKIVDIVNEWHWFQKRDANGNTIWQANDTEKLATTLISAGIGDVKEAEHRAEVAERALKEFAVQVGCEDCPFWEGCNYSEPIPTNDFQCF